MNGFDLAVLLAAALLVLFGAYRGLLRVGLGIAGLVLGLLLALRWEGAAAPYVRRVVDNDLWAPLLAFVGVVVASVLASILLAWFLRSVLKVAHLLWLDRILGATAGLLCAVLLAAAVAVLLASNLPADSRLLTDSMLAPYTLEVSKGVVRLAPEDLRRKFEAGLQRITATRVPLPARAS